MSDSGTYGKKSVPTRPMMPRVRESDDEQPTKIRCPTCSTVSTHGGGKLGCPVCHGEGFITVERYFEMTERCPTCVGSGRVTHEQREALDANAKLHEARK
jgi:DnaJ-class molecular chaperone